ncbi:exodeoxyribonuclease III [Nemorincola caseinilytica]|uniref:Exodeoxyribonuclease III n=1 Tax=Nemorincola caseinilytica TaxID=2054315 RepID=A0ABP8NH58_9BACT
MRIITYNVNGIRGAIKKGFLDWLKTDPADIICLQEIKANKEDVPAAELKEAGYDVFSFSAQKKGYSGVAILTRIQPDNVQYGNGIMQSDAEGRVIRADFGDITLVNAYFPSGTSGDDRQTYKYQWLDEFFEYLNVLRTTRPRLVICGDYNICHKAIDIHDPVRNKNYTGFLPEERAWMDKLYCNGYIDSFREFNQEPHQYTWWSAWGTARANNKGWRIDYITVTEPLKDRLKHAEILPQILHSDHCPMYMEMK